MKKLALFLAVALLFAAVLPAEAFAASKTFASGKFGNLKWTLDEDGVLTISGKGKMPDMKWVPAEYPDSGDWTEAYEPECILGGSYVAPWDEWISDTAVTRVVVEKGVTSIGAGAFMSLGQVPSVELPEGVTSIGRAAFAAYPGFADDGFYEIRFPDSLQTIEEYAFFGCNMLLEDIVFPKNLRSIGDYAFTYCRISSVAFPEGLESIGEGAFQHCMSWWDYFEEDLDEGAWAKTVSIPASVKSLGSNPFSDCLRLDRIEVAEDNPCFRSVDGVLFSKDGTRLIAFPPARLSEKNPEKTAETNEETDEETYGLPWLVPGGEYEIPEGVTAIDALAFSGFNLTKITLPETVEKIDTHAFSCCKAIDDYNLAGCRLAAIETAEGNRAFRSVDGVLYSADMRELVCYPSRRKTTSFTVPEGVRVIRGAAFYGCKLDEVVLHDGLEEIGEDAFAYAEIQKLAFPESLKTIGPRAFHQFFFSEDILTIPLAMEIIGAEAFWGSGTRNIVVPEGVTEIGERAFLSPYGPYSVTLPISLKTIGKEVFYCGKIQFAGTAAQWKEIRIAENAFADTEDSRIVCSDRTLGPS